MCSPQARGRQVPAVNAVIDADEIVYRDYTDISIAVATPKGLVVPVLRNVDSLSFAEVEKVRCGGALHACRHSSSASVACVVPNLWRPAS